MGFHAIDFMTWPRRETFWYFTKMAPTSYSLTVDVDVTDLYQKTKSAGVRFFPVYLWLVTKCLNKQIEFKVAYEGETLGYYDELTPLYACFHEDDKTFSLMWTAYSEDFRTFYDRYLQNKADSNDKHGILGLEGTPPANAYTVSCIPWVEFKHFAVHTHDNKNYFFPSIEAGKITCKDDGRRIMPLSLTCHHATTDGYHVNQFLEDLKEEMRVFEA